MPSSWPTPRAKPCHHPWVQTPCDEETTVAGHGTCRNSGKTARTWTTHDWETASTDGGTASQTFTNLHIPRRRPFQNLRSLTRPSLLQFNDQNSKLSALHVLGGFSDLSVHWREETCIVCPILTVSALHVPQNRGLQNTQWRK